MNVQTKPAEDAASIVAELGRRAKTAAAALRTAPTDAKNKALADAARLIRGEKAVILAANARDIDAAKAAGMSSALQDRLLLNDARIEGMAKGLDDIVALPDPVGATIEEWQRPNGLVISRVRVPIGIIGVIYEARPNVTADAGALCIKSGNVVVLRGGSDSFHSSRAIVELLRQALKGRRPARGLRAARADHGPRRRRRDAAGHGLARPDRAARRTLVDRSRDAGKPRAGAAPL
jgi:glutamate-5-semialdehyde dehydrogenase